MSTQEREKRSISVPIERFYRFKFKIYVVKRLKVEYFK